MKDTRAKKVVPFDVMLRRFKNKVEEDGILQAVREKEFYEKPAAAKQRKKKAAIQRERRRQSEGVERPRQY